MSLRNQVQLITYPDSLGGNLASLAQCLEDYFPGAFGGVHVLPPFPSTGDRGFAPVSYFEIESRFGSWGDIARLGQKYDVLLDLMVNHISRRSFYFADFARYGRKSTYADMFLTLDKIWPGGVPVQEDVEKIFLRRPEHFFADVAVETTGQVERVWATFGRRDWSEQIDLDVNSPVTRDLFRQTFEFLHTQGVNTLRLDAIAFVIKKRGTSCFLVEPEIYEFLDWIKALAEKTGLNLLLEVHTHISQQARLEQHGFWVYNFALPGLILHSLLAHDGTKLAAHLANCPQRQVTMLDCHDGIPVLPDLEDVLSLEEAQKLVAHCEHNGANVSRIFSRQHRAGDFAAHQINCTYYSALSGDDDAYIAARAIQFFAPGIPQVYYVGLLAGENDPEAVRESGEGRAINRHNFSPEEVAAQCGKSVVQRLLKLIHFRNQCPAFEGEFFVRAPGPAQLELHWQKGACTCTLSVDLKTAHSAIKYIDEKGIAQVDIP